MYRINSAFVHDRCLANQLYDLLGRDLSGHGAQNRIGPGRMTSRLARGRKTLASGTGLTQ